MTDFSGLNMSLDEWEQRIGDAIRQARINAGYNQKELAERANLPCSTVQALEQGVGTGGRTQPAADAHARPPCDFQVQESQRAHVPGVATEAGVDATVQDSIGPEPLAVSASGVEATQ